MMMDRTKQFMVRLGRDHKRKGEDRMRIFAREIKREKFIYWFLPYIVYIFISVVLSSLSYFQAVRVISEQTMSAHEESVNAIHYKIEPILSTTKNAMSRVISNGLIESVCEDPKLSKSSTYYTMGQLQSELHATGRLSEAIQDEYIYFAEAILSCPGPTSWEKMRWTSSL